MCEPLGDLFQPELSAGFVLLSNPTLAHCKRKEGEPRIGGERTQDTRTSNHETKA